MGGVSGRCNRRSVCAGAECGGWTGAGGGTGRGGRCTVAGSSACPAAGRATGSTPFGGVPLLAVLHEDLAEHAADRLEPADGVLVGGEHGGEPPLLERGDLLAAPVGVAEARCWARSRASDIVASACRRAVSTRRFASARARGELVVALAPGAVDDLRGGLAGRLERAARLAPRLLEHAGGLLGGGVALLLRLLLREPQDLRHPDADLLVRRPRLQLRPRRHEVVAGDGQLAPGVA